MKRALVNDWYYINSGAEKVVKSIDEIWDNFEHYALIDFYNDADREFILKGKKATTSFLQKLPTSKGRHRNYLQLYPYAIEQFDLAQYDLIISSSASVAKNVLTHHEQLHICYCHSPLRYAWDMYHEYLRDTGLTKGLKGMYAKYVLHNIRMWDQLGSQRVDHFIANSHFVKNRIKKVYNRDAVVIYPPVDTDFFALSENKEDFYYVACRLIPYKKVDVIVEAFNDMPNKKLIVAGDGPQLNKLKKTANKNIEFKGYISHNDNLKYMQAAKAFIFAAKEDFGIVPVEAQACGTPVIAFGRGGLLETVVDNKTGIFFYDQTPAAISRAVEHFETLTFNYKAIREHALQFSTLRFQTEIKQFVDEKWKQFTTMHNKAQNI